MYIRIIATDSDSYQHVVRTVVMFRFVVTFGFHVVSKFEFIE
jgi:hypothetical protein